MDTVNSVVNTRPSQQWGSSSISYVKTGWIFATRENKLLSISVLDNYCGPTEDQCRAEDMR